MIFTPEDLTGGLRVQPENKVVAGFNLNILKAAHGFVLDSSGTQFMKTPSDGAAVEEQHTFEMLQVVRIWYEGQICPGQFQRVCASKLTEAGVTDVVTPLSQKPTVVVNEYFFNSAGP